MGSPRRRLARRRKQSGYSQESLAEAIQVDRTTIGRWETGDARPRPALRPVLARTLSLTLDELDELFNESDDDEPQPGQVVEQLEAEPEEDDVDRRRFLTLAGQAFASVVLDPTRVLQHDPNILRGLAPPSVIELTRSVDHIRRLYQDCRYDQVVDLLPTSLGQLHAAQEIAPEATQADLAVLVAHSYHVASSILLKFNAPDEARAVANQALLHARRSENPIAIGAASRIVTHALMADGDRTAAIDFASTGASLLDDEIGTHSPDSLSIYGALLLRGAVAAGQAGDGDTARTLLDEAERAALRLGADHNYQWTAFGPNNVIAHRVAIELALGNAGNAVDHFRSMNVDEMPVAERRAIVHMDVARAYTQWAKYDEALAALRTTAQIAPQELNRPVARETIHHIDTLAPAAVRSGLRSLTTANL